MANNTVFTKQLGAASDNSISASQTPGSSTLLINGSAATAGVATIDTATAANSAIGRRVLITSGGDDHLITWAVVGTNNAGATISDTILGTNATTSYSNLDFVTVTKITPSGAVASTVKVGTNGVGSSPWQTMNWQNSAPMNITALVELVSGSANYTVEYTLDDPNNLTAGVVFPLNLSDLSPTALVTASATKDGLFNFPLIALRLTINSGTGALRARVVQSGIG